MNIAIWPADEGGLRRLAAAQRLWCAAALLASLSGCDGAPSRNILGSYFPSWMVCALLGLALALVARAIFKALGILGENPLPPLFSFFRVGFASCVFFFAFVC